MRGTQTALVTGAAGGIGLAISERLAREGYRVGMLDLDPARIAAAAATVPGAVALAADVTDAAGLEAALAQLGDVPDVLVANAGIVRRGRFIEQSLKDLRDVVEVNLLGAMLPCWFVGRGMASRGSGAIIAISSVVGLTGGVNTGAYGPTKAALVALMRTLAVELGPLGVRANAIAPGLIDAGMGSIEVYDDPDVPERRRQAVPARRFGTGADIAAAVAWLVSDGAAYVNGQVLAVDGGLLQTALSQLPAKRARGGR